eukprot:m.438870 g.438870  ORF g.438870 m.438870 type:complete len:370 (+) comp18297_c0_seq1:411-1520(+)
MSGPVANAWVRPLTALAASNGQSDPALRDTAARSRNTETSENGTQVPASPCNAKKSKGTPAPPPTNPWKKVAPSQTPTTIADDAVKKTPAVKSWPALGESVKDPQQKAASAVAAGGPAKPTEKSSMGKTGKKDKWVPFEEELPLHSRRNEEGSRNRRDRPRREQRGSRHNSSQSAANGGSAARAEYGNNGYPAPHFPTFQPDSSAAGFYPAQPAYHAFAPSYPPMGMLDPNMRVHPSVGVPPMAMTDPAALSAAIQYQVEYYLSIDNLLRDLYLRGHMDMGGWVPLSHLATFKRLSTLSTNIAEIAACLTSSVELEVKDGAYVRRREDWQQFLPVVPRDPAAAAHPPSPSSSTGSTTFNVMARAFVPGR